MFCDVKLQTVFIIYVCVYIFLFLKKKTRKYKKNNIFPCTPLFFHRNVQYL